MGKGHHTPKKVSKWINIRASIIQTIHPPIHLFKNIQILYMILKRINRRMDGLNKHESIDHSNHPSIY